MEQNCDNFRSRRTLKYDRFRPSTRKKKNKSSYQLSKSSIVIKFERTMSDNSTYNLTEFQKCQLLNQNAMVHSESSIRRKCFNFRVRMIIKPFYQFLSVLLIGMMFIIMPIVSVIIVSQKFMNSLYPGQNDHIQDVFSYSSAVYPLIVVETFITIGLMI